MKLDPQWHYLIGAGMGIVFWELFQYVGKKIYRKMKEKLSCL